MRESEGEDADADERTGLAQCDGAGFKGGAAGQDIVDKEDVLVLQTFGMLHDETALLMFQAFIERQFDLRRGVPMFLETGGLDGQMPHLSQSESDMIGLVVAARQTSPEMYRHGYEDIDVMRPAFLLQFGGKKMCQPTIDPGFVLIFGSTDQVCRLRRIAEEGGGMHEIQSAEEIVFHSIASRTCMHSRQVRLANQTEGLFTLNQEPATMDAALGE